MGGSAALPRQEPDGEGARSCTPARPSRLPPHQSLRDLQSPPAGGRGLAAVGGRCGQVGACTLPPSPPPPTPSRALDLLSPRALQENVAAAETAAKPGAGAGRGRRGRARRGSLTGRGEQRQQQQQRRERPAPQPPHGSFIILRVQGLRRRAARRGLEEGRAGRRGLREPRAGAPGSRERGGSGARAGGCGDGGREDARLSALRPRPSRRGCGLG